MAYAKRRSPWSSVYEVWDAVHPLVGPGGRVHVNSHSSYPFMVIIDSKIVGDARVSPVYGHYHSRNFSKKYRGHALRPSARSRRPRWAGALSGEITFLIFFCSDSFSADGSGRRVGKKFFFAQNKSAGARAGAARAAGRVPIGARKCFWRKFQTFVCRLVVLRLQASEQESRGFAIRLLASSIARKPSLARRC